MGQVRPGLPAACLDGLNSFSHCWLIYLFHANTDMDALLRSQAPRLSQPHDSSAGQKGHSSTSESSREGIKGKVRVPRLNGGRVGVLATRTPHRPCPLGEQKSHISKLAYYRL